MMGKYGKAKNIELLLWIEDDFEYSSFIVL